MENQSRIQSSNPIHICQVFQFQMTTPSPSPISASQLLEKSTDAAPSDVFADFLLPFGKSVGPVVVLAVFVGLASVSVGWAALEPGNVHDGATVVSP